MKDILCCAEKGGMNASNRMCHLTKIYITLAKYALSLTINIDHC